MNWKSSLFFLSIIFLTYSCVDDPTIVNPVDPGVELYFPPTTGSDWETSDAEDLGWDKNKMLELKEYLKLKNTKGFMILKDGKIVMEEYMNGHSIQANHNWFSAVKSLTSTAVGMAQAANFLDIEEKTSSYLGEDWSSLTKEKQDLIKVRHHLSMTTGLANIHDPQIAWICTQPECMQYDADAGTQWAYHQGAFTQTQNILTKATGQNFKGYIKENILDRTGMNGSWIDFFGVNIFSSTTRSMARFGLLTLNKGTWDDTEIYPESYYDQMIESSQDINKAYGYLWWLNGKSDFQGTTNSEQITGSLIPNAPNDMFAALGLDDQKIYVVPSERLVIVRCGDASGNSEFASSSFDNELWGKINEIIY